MRNICFCFLGFYTNGLTLVNQHIELYSAIQEFVHRGSTDRGESLLTHFALLPSQRHGGQANLASFMQILDVCQKELEFLQLKQDIS